MSDTEFTDYVTPIPASWLNDVNDHTYNSTPVSPATTVHPASVIANTPAGTIVATTVQAAIDELDADVATKAALAGSASQTFSALTLKVGDQGTEGSGINIGGVTYDSSFKVSDINGTNYAQTIFHRHSTTLEPLLVGARSNSDTSSHAAVTAGQGLFSVYGAGSAGTNYKLFGQMQIAADDSGTISDTSAPGKLVFKVTPDASVTPATALTINNSGAATFASTVGVGAATAVGHAVRASQIQGASLTAFTTAGTSTAYTLTPTPAITAYTANQTFDVVFNNACGAAPTLAISGVATPPNLVKQNLDGTYSNLAAGDFPSGWQSSVKLVSASQACVLLLPKKWQVAQVVSTQVGTNASATTILPADDTIPQNTEGDQYMSLAITPTNASSTLEINVTIMASSSAAAVQITAALFQDTTANALAAMGHFAPTANGRVSISFKHIMSAGTISATTFKVRVGASGAGTTTFNNLFGGVTSSRITITEYLP